MGCLDEPTVLAFVGGRVRGDAAEAAIDEHLASCQACRDLVVLAARTTLVTSPPPRAEAPLDAEVPAERYTITGLLGAGGQALVYAAHDNLLGRTVALKILRDARDAGVLDEARLAARLSHPHIVAVHDAGVLRDGQLYLALEYVAGGSLDAWLVEGAHAREDVLRVLAEAGRGLAAAHDAGIVHRDIKPANILVGPDGRARVTDFGLASIGRTTRVAGTLAYMAPEQRAGHATPASDQFSFGVTAWEALTGALPAGPGAGRRGLPRYLERALRRALDPDPARRWPSVHALVHVLARDPRRTWARAGVAALGVVALGTGAFVAVRAGDDAVTCTGLAASAWTADARARVERAFAASTRSYAAGARVAVLAQLDAYASALDAARTDACEATARGAQSTELLDRRNACLDERDGALRATAAILARADEAVVEHGLELVRGLPAIAACADRAWLRERVPGPTEAAARARVAAIGEQLATSSAQLRAGKLVEAVATAEAAAAAVAGLAHAPTRARVELALGMARAKLGETARAEQHLQAAAQLGQRGRDDLATAEAWIELVKVIGHGNARYDEALRYAGFAEATAARLGDERGTTALRARLDYYRCAILDLQARLAEAAAACARAATARTQLFGADAPEVADVLVVQARLAHKRSQPAEAQAAIARAIAIREATLGPDHPGLMEALFAAGQLALGAGRLDDAEAQLARAMAIGRAAVGDDALVMAPLYAQTAAVLQLRGKLPEALSAIDRSAAIRERIEGKDHADLVFDHTMRGRILEDLGREHEAVTAYERAQAIAERALGEAHPSLSAILQDLGRLHGKLGKRDVARGELDRALAIATASEAPAAVGAATSALAELLHLGGQPAEALPHYQRALATYEVLLGPDHPQLAATLMNLGLAHLDVREPKVALPHLERALALEAKRSGDASPQLLLPLTSLGEAQLAIGDRAAAKRTWQRALALPDIATVYPDDVRALRAKLAGL